MELFTKDFIKNYFKRNKKFLIISLLILILGLIIGIICGYISVGGNSGQISEALLSTSSQNVKTSPIPNLSWSGLFLHNTFIDLITIVFGLLFSVVSIIIVAFNGYIIGLMFGIDPLLGIMGIIPHGIFEYTGSIFGLTGAFLVTKFVINLLKGIFTKKCTVKGVLTGSTILYKDILITIIFMVCLLAIAAFIEAYITPICVSSYYGV